MYLCRWAHTQEYYGAIHNLCWGFLMLMFVFLQSCQQFWDMKLYIYLREINWNSMQIIMTGPIKNVLDSLNYVLIRDVFIEKILKIHIPFWFQICFDILDDKKTFEIVKSVTKSWNLHLWLMQQIVYTHVSKSK